MAPKPQPWYAKFNQPKRNPNGRNWKPTPSTHRDPADGAGGHTTIRTGLPPSAWRSLNAPTQPIAGVDPGDADDTGLIWHNFQYKIYSTFKEPKPAPIPYAGVRAGEIIGHRMWVILDNLELCSLAHYYIWQPGATISGDINEVVDNFHFMAMTRYGGVYSYFSPEPIVEELKEFDYDPLPRPISFGPFFMGNFRNLHGVAIGTIKCWGEVIEHEKGWRAQYAKLTSIDSVVGPVDITELRRKYNV